MSINFSSCNAFISILVASVVLVMSTGASVSAEQTNLSYSQKGKISSSLYNDFMKQLDSDVSTDGNSTTQTFLSQIKTKENGRREKEYPQDYAGAYMDENGDLVICLTSKDAIKDYNRFFDNNIKKTKEQLQEQVKMNTISETYILNQVKYQLKDISLSSLITIQENLESKMSEFGINEIQISQKDNKILIFLYDLNKQSNINDYLIELGVNHEIIKYYKAKKDAMPTGTNCYNGTEILGGSTSMGSIGFHAIHNSTGKYGIITNGHVIESSQTAYKGSTKIGKPSIWIVGGNMDIAFIPYDTSKINTTSTVKAANWVSAIYGWTYPLEGQNVERWGISSGHTTATITSTYITKTVNYGGSIGMVSLHGLFEMNSPIISGDSGGPILSWHNIVGINVGTTPSTSYGINVANILSQNNLSLVAGAQWLN